MRKLKTNMRYLMQLRQSPSMVVPRAEASPCPWEKTTQNVALNESCRMLTVFPSSCNLNRHLDETAKKIILSENLFTLLMSSATQTYDTHTHTLHCQFIWSNSN